MIKENSFGLYSATCDRCGKDFSLSYKPLTTEHPAILARKMLENYWHLDLIIRKITCFSCVEHIFNPKKGPLNDQLRAYYADKLTKKRKNTTENVQK